MYQERLITQKLKLLAESFPAIVVMGARQVGKSTLLQHVFGKIAETVTFDPVVDIENARQDPELFLNNHRTPLILDEIQYAPEVVGVIKRRIDKERKPGQYFLTGSQQWGVLKTMAESLAGRAAFIDLSSFSLAESVGMPASWLESWLTQQTQLFEKQNRLWSPCLFYEQLWRGFFPEIQNLPLQTVSAFYTGYLRTYIERDVRLLEDINDLQLFSRFVRIAAALTAQEINTSHIGRELGITPQTARRWLNLLISTFQWIEIPAFSGNLIKRITHKAKGYLTDTGFACFLQSLSSPQALAGYPRMGTLFETAVVMELRKQSAIMNFSPYMYHWRAHSGAEVDVILEYDGCYFPIEIKSNTHPSRQDARGIHAFRESHPTLRIAKGLIIAPAEKAYPITENDWVMPWDYTG